ncbi:MAG: hypothetical protein AB9833_08990 [Bacteroidales bacterium]
MKLNRFLTVVALAVLSVSLTSCNKEQAPIVLAGSWKIDTVGTALGIVYNQVYAEENPVALQFLKDNKEKVRKLLFNPERIVFDATDAVTFNYKSSAPVVGTYTKTDFYFKITNSVFPEGINGASDNIYLELYYPKDYLMGLLFSILTENDPPESAFISLIDKFEAIGLYTKTPTL